MLILRDGDTGELITPLTQQTLQYIGSPNETTSAPNYASNHYITDGDSLTTAASELDAQLFTTTSALAALIGAPDPFPQYILADGSRAFTGDQSVGGHKFTNLGAPAAGGDAANKTYVDGTIASAVANYLPLAGGTMSGPINMGNNLIHNVTNPAAAQDAATKNYVDGLISGLGLASTSGTYVTSNAATVTQTPGLIGGVPADTLILMSVNRRSDDNTFKYVAFGIFKKILASSNGASFDWYSATNGVTGYENTLGFNTVPASAGSATYQSTTLLAGVRAFFTPLPAGGDGVGTGAHTMRRLPAFGTISYTPGYANGTVLVPRYPGPGAGYSATTVWTDTPETHQVLDSWTNTQFVVGYNPETSSDPYTVNTSIFNNAYVSDDTGNTGWWLKDVQWWAIVDPKNYLLSQLRHFFMPTMIQGGGAPATTGGPTRYENLPAPADLLALFGW